MSSMIIHADNVAEQELLRIAAKLAHIVSAGVVIFLQGPLGAGKTTFMRGMLNALGHQGKVKSPTYALVEQYEFSDFVINHFDLYRVENPEELEHMGVRDYFQPNAVCLIEWPEKALILLPKPDIQCDLDFDGDHRTITLTACSRRGNEMLLSLNL